MLLRIPNWLGDALMATPVYDNLKDLEEIILFGKESFIKLFEDFPKVKILPYDPNDCKKNLEILKPFKKEKGLLLTNSFSSAFLFFRAGISERIGYTTDLRGFLLTKKIKPPKEKLHQRDKYLYLLEALKIPIKRRDLVLYLSEEKVEKAKNFLKELKIDLSRPIILIAPGAAYGPAKKWPISYFRELLEKLSREGYTLLVVGGENEAEEGKFLSEGLKNTYNLCGKTEITLLAGLFKLSTLLISNDSGLMHLGAALRISQIAIFGSTDPEYTGPLNPKAIVLKEDLPCSPCFERTCPKGNYRCLKEITPQRVYEVFKKILQNQPY
ncbi:MAG: lipopolysaccharide heptosyltransferase II [Caldimicrobium thiodismutans]